MSKATTAHPPTLQLSTRPINLFDNLPPTTTTIFIHACNAQGVWGTGVALQLKQRYPAAYDAYKAYCAQQKRAGKEREMLGQAMLTPFAVFRDRDTTAPRSTSTLIPTFEVRRGDVTHKDKVIIANLFTRRTYGAPTAEEKRAGYENAVLVATCTAMASLLALIERLLLEGVLIEEGLRQVEMRMPMINSGKFNVPWAETKRVLERLVVPERLRASGVSRIVVCCPSESG